MTREEVARRIGWSRIIWFAGIVNVVGILPQLWRILSTRQSQDVSLLMLGIFLFVQVAFSLEGFFTKNKMLMVCLALSAVVNVATIIATLVYR